MQRAQQRLQPPHLVDELLQLRVAVVHLPAERVPLLPQLLDSGAAAAARSGLLRARAESEGGAEPIRNKGS